MRLLLIFFAILFLPNAFAQTKKEADRMFTQADIAFLKKFALSALPALPNTPSNRFADDIKVAEFGQKLFFDARLSANEKVSCASCHDPQQYFTDGLPQSLGLGKTRRSAPSLLGVAWSPWLFWDGRKDSLWSQALGPFEAPLEMGISRSELAKKIIRFYKKDYEILFGKIEHKKTIEREAQKATPNGAEEQISRWNKLSENTQHSINTVFVNLGKSLMAYQRQLSMSPAKFDQFIADLEKQPNNTDRLSNAEIHGLRLFMGKANCASCHNGPLFTNFEFHNVSAPEPDSAQVDLGRHSGVSELTLDEFTCLSDWSDASEEECLEMLFLKSSGPELVGAFKTPTLRNIARTAPYMQSGQLATLEDVINHYDKPTPPVYNPEQHPSRPHFDILPLQLSDSEKADLIAFLETLTSPIPKKDRWWHPPE
jgi:cytochrome c peroxidase